MQLRKTCFRCTYLVPQQGILLRYNQLYLQNKYLQALKRNYDTKIFPQLPYRFFFSSSQKSDGEMTEKEINSINEILETQKEGIEQTILEPNKFSSNDTKKIYWRICNHILARIIKTCQIYLKSSVEQRNSVKADSRFIYVKKVIDQLTLEEQEEFRTHLEQVNHQRLSNNFLLDKTDFETFLGGEDKNGTTLRSLYIDFVGADNYDRLWDLNPHEDEVNIGKIEKVFNRLKEAAIKALTVDLNVFQENLPFDNTKNSKRSIFKTSKVPISIYGSILNQIINTCELYLDFLPEQRNSVTTESRFHYIKTRIDPLTFQEEEEFRTYIKHCKFFGSRYQKSKKIAKKMFKEGRNGAILCSLYFDFIEADNHDRLLFTSPDEDEIIPGKIQKIKRKAYKRHRLVKALTLDLKKVQYASQEFREINDEGKSETDQVKKYSKTYVYTFTFRRVVSTCLIYLNSSPEERNSVDANSRFYYVKQSLGNMSYDEEQKFKEYLYRVPKPHFQHKKIQNILVMHDDLPSKSLNDMEATNNCHIETRKKKTRRISFKELGDFLKEEKNGNILKDLLYKFLTNDNRDLFWALNLEEDETTIGNIQKVKKKQARFVLGAIKDDLKIYQKRFRKFEFLCYECRR